MIHFTADTHFNHFPILQYTNRPFKTVDEMNKTLIDNWNKKVHPRDIIYHLGDFAWGINKGYATQGVKEIIEQLNGQIFVILGSHDKPIEKLYKEGCNKIIKITPLLNIKFNKQDIILCHYCMRTWKRSHYNSWHLYGHSHGRLEPIGKSWDVGIDNNNYFPLSFYDIREIMKTRPNNFNHIETHSGRGL